MFFPLDFTPVLWTYTRQIQDIYWENTGQALDKYWANHKCWVLAAGLDITDDGCDRKRSGLMARDTEIHTGENTGWPSLANDGDDDDDDL